MRLFKAILRRDYRRRGVVRGAVHVSASILRHQRHIDGGLCNGKTNDRTGLGHAPGGRRGRPPRALPPGSQPGRWLASHLQTRQRRRRQRGPTLAAPAGVQAAWHSVETPCAGRRRLARAQRARPRRSFLVAPYGLQRRQAWWTATACARTDTQHALMRPRCICFYMLLGPHGGFLVGSGARVFCMCCAEKSCWGREGVMLQIAAHAHARAHARACGMPLARGHAVCGVKCHA